MKYKKKALIVDGTSRFSMFWLLPVVQNHNSTGFKVQMNNSHVTKVGQGYGHLTNNLCNVLERP